MEKLYNNICLEDDFMNGISDAQNVPYLKNPPDVADVTVGRQLFVDDFLVEKCGLEYCCHKAGKFEGNPVFFAETPWEKEIAPGACAKTGGIWYDEREKVFKMWYEAGWLNKMAYAVSRDGINWQRPELSEVKGTNIILPYEADDLMKISDFGGKVTYLRPNSGSVIIDTEAPESERYKLFIRNPGAMRPGIIATSGDGIHFRDFRFTGKTEDRSTMFYNPFRKKWVFSARWHEWEGKFERCRYYCECDGFYDAEDWKDGECHPWMKTDELDLQREPIGEKPQLYNVDCIAYESIMIGMFQILYGPANIACAHTGKPKITELIPMYSRDGYHFSRPSRESIIGISENGWDRGYVQSVAGGTVINGDEVWIYYCAFRGDEAHKTELEEVYSGMYHNSAMGIAKLRRDGFVSLEGDGEILTRKLIFSGKSGMMINAVGEVSVTLLSDGGEELAKAEFCGDSTCAKLDFKDFLISSLNGKVFRARFCVKGKLYSFGFTDEKGDCGGAHAAGVVK